MLSERIFHSSEEIVLIRYYLLSADRVLDMCGLGPFADAAIGSLGVEQKKRTTIGVELAAKVCP